MFIFVALIALSALVHAAPSGTPRRRDSVYPSLEETPNELNIALLGPELTREAAKDDFSEKVLKKVITQVFYQADTMTFDGLLDKAEVAIWLKKNANINKAVEAKLEFLACDADEDSLLTFAEYCECDEGGCDGPTMREYFKWSNSDKEMNSNLLTEEMPDNIEENGKTFPNFAKHLQILYKIFLASDTNKDDKLTWDEFIVFSYPDEYEETYKISAYHLVHRRFDDTGDEKYNMVEFAKYYNNHITIAQLMPTGQETSDGMFKHCDTDGDKLVSFTEADTCMRGHIAFADHQATDWLMGDGDANKDGFLDQDEVVNEFEYITEDDEYWDEQQLRDEL